MSDALDFTGKVVLITGAATGIGRATALAFAEHGAKVVIGDLDPRGADTVKAITDKGGTGLFVPTDVSVASQVEALVRTAVDTYGRLDVAFNNAGVLPPTAPLAEQSEKDFDRTIAVDLKGVFLCLKYELAYLASAGGGAIINTSSIAGLVADPGMAPYAAAKHGVIGLTKAAALDYGAAGIRVNAIAPGLVDTAMTKGWQNSEIWEQIASSNVLHRAAAPEEIAGTVLYLASDLASFTTGAVFTVDGAQTAH